MTLPHLPVWPSADAAFRRSEVAAVVGHGDEAWNRATHDVLCWKVKTRSGFRVHAEGPVVAGEQLIVTARVLWLTIQEPIEVVSVVQTAQRVGFAYRTLPGHPVSGEEAFIVHRDGDAVVLTIRSLTQAARHQPWRMLYPALRVAQLFARRRYLRALR